jgi:predicted permease
LYLLIFQQLGQLVRWSWGYHVLLAPPSSYEEPNDDLEEGRYRDEPDLIPGLDGNDSASSSEHDQEASTISFESGGRTPVTHATHDGAYDSDASAPDVAKKTLTGATPTNGNVFPHAHHEDDITSFPHIGNSPNVSEEELPSGIRGVIPRTSLKIRQGKDFITRKISTISQKSFHALPQGVQHVLTKIYLALARFFNGLWEFMNPPLWAMLIAVIVASIPRLQRLFFEDGTFISNSVTRAVTQSGGVAVPLILVVLGANLARNTLPQESLDENSEENKIGTKLLIASLISRMLLPTIVMAPILAIFAKYVPVSILDDPIFVIVCFLLVGAPSALQLAQICQINGVYEGVMSKLLFQSYVIWYVNFLPCYCVYKY